MQNTFEELKTLGDSNFNQKNYELAIHNYSEALLIDDYKSDLAYLNRSLAYFKLDKYEEALQDAIKATELRKFYPKAWGRVGSCLMALNRLDDAKVAFNRALQLEPTDENFKKQVLDLEKMETPEIEKMDTPEMDMNSLMDKMKKLKVESNGEFPIEGLMGNLFTKMMKNEKLLSLTADPNFQVKMSQYKQNPLSALNNPDIMELVKDVIKELH
jgi:tetratricopeptide (TPR) repeat protein